MNLAQKIRQIRSNHRGVAIIEFAIVLPLLLILLIGVIDVTNYVFAYNQAYRVAGAVVNATGRLKLTSAQLSDILANYDVLFQRLDADATNSNVIISVYGRRPLSANNNNTNLVQLWSLRGGSGLWASRYNVTSIQAKGLDIAIGQSIIVAEVNYKFNPFVVGYVLGSDLNVYGFAVGRPRAGDILELPTS